MDVSLPCSRSGGEDDFSSGCAICRSRLAKSRDNHVARCARNPLTDSVLLRDVEEDDLPVFFEHQLDPEATRMAAFSARDRKAFLAH